MFLRASVHVFTNKPKKFVDYVLDEYTDEEMAQNALELYIQRIFSIQESFGERPLHRVTERFAKEVFSAFSAPTESETVINELKRRGAHFNINGDVALTQTGFLRICCESSSANALTLITKIYSLTSCTCGLSFFRISLITARRRRLTNRL